MNLHFNRRDRRQQMKALPDPGFSRHLRSLPGRTRFWLVVSILDLGTRRSVPVPGTAACEGVAASDASTIAAAEDGRTPGVFSNLGFVSNFVGRISDFIPPPSASRLLPLIPFIGVFTAFSH